MAIINEYEYNIMKYNFLIQTKVLQLLYVTW